MGGVTDNHDDHPDARGVPFALRDGTEVLLRPVLPLDRERIRAAFHRLSLQSRYLRFFTGKSELSDELLTYFSEVDQVSHVAWGAVDPRSPELPGVGLGRFARLADDPTWAEAAVAVADEFQRKGLGGVLLAILYLEAEARGVRALTALVLPENHFALEWFQSLGATFELKPDAYQLELPVNRTCSDSPARIRRSCSRGRWRRSSRSSARRRSRRVVGADVTSCLCVPERVRTKKRAPDVGCPCAFTSTSRVAYASTIIQSRSLRSASCSIWRTRSRVRPMRTPISLSVIGSSPSSP
jgi:GNAT superfamily N-acetyltransferase